MQGIPHGVVYVDDYFFVITTENELLKLNNKLEKVDSRKFKSIGPRAIATDKKNIFVSADNSFIAFDTSLKELSRVKLEYNGVEKNAHDILIYNKNAYLLDNIWVPIFIFQVNIENPKDIQVVKEIDLSGSNPHLKAQWLNPELNQWLILRSYIHPGGTGQDVFIYPMDMQGDKTVKAMNVQNIYSYLSIEKNRQGVQLHTVTPLPPTSAIIEKGNKNYYLARVTSENNTVSFSDLLKLEGIKMVAPMRRRGDYLFIISGNNYSQIDHLQIVNVKGAPEVLFAKQLTEFNLHSIIDILSY